MALTAERIAAVLVDRQRVITSLDEAHDLARSSVDPELLARCEGRIAQLLGDAAPQRTPGSALDQAALVFTEQWVIDVASMTDAMVGDLVDHLGEDGLMDFVHALLVVEQRIRLGLAWKQLGFVS
jgi:hypothetical protein